MFANRYTAFVDACSLFSPLTRNLLLTLAEHEFFRIRWSAIVLDETERAIGRFLEEKGEAEAFAIAKRQRKNMESAFDEAMISGFDTFGRPFA